MGLFLQIITAALSTVVGLLVAGYVSFEFVLPFLVEYF